MSDPLRACPFCHIGELSPRGICEACGTAKAVTGEQEEIMELHGHPVMRKDYTKSGRRLGHHPGK